MLEIKSKTSIAAFEGLRALAGQWRDINSTTLVEFRESACGSIFVETWTWPETEIEALTIYFLDRNQLVATHYCPLGNQPTLNYVPSLGEYRFDFHYVSATNLSGQSKDHCESFWFDIVGDDEFVRSESYRENGALDTKQSIYKRVL